MVFKSMSYSKQIENHNKMELGSINVGMKSHWYMYHINSLSLLKKGFYYHTKFNLE